MAAPRKLKTLLESEIPAWFALPAKSTGLTILLSTADRAPERKNRLPFA